MSICKHIYGISKQNRCINEFSILYLILLNDIDKRNRVLTAKLLKQGNRYHRLRKAFSEFNRRHFDILSKYNVG